MAKKKKSGMNLSPMSLVKSLGDAVGLHVGPTKKTAKKKTATKKKAAKKAAAPKKKAAKKKK